MSYGHAFLRLDGIDDGLQVIVLGRIVDDWPSALDADSDGYRRHDEYKMNLFLFSFWPVQYTLEELLSAAGKRGVKLSLLSACGVVWWKSLMVDCACCFPCRIREKKIQFHVVNGFTEEKADLWYKPWSTFFKGLS
jgi:hypothetical protein